MTDQVFSSAQEVVSEFGAGEVKDGARMSERLKLAVDDWSVDYFRDDFRWHMGASIIGGPCDRAIWYDFRWATPDSRNGRMKRLHNRGHDEEQKFITALEGIGFKVFHTDPNTNRQFKISLCNGHFGGSCDGVVIHPEDWNIPGGFLLETKTSQTGSTFNKLIEEGCKAKREQHFIQQSVYGYNMGLSQSLYAVVNKNDDDIYFEYVDLSPEKALWAEKRASNIIATDYVPARIPGAKESFFQCRMCDHNDVCNKGKPMAVNCRSCVYATPSEQAQWRCNKYGMDIPREYVYKGCGDYKAIA